METPLKDTADSELFKKNVERWELFYPREARDLPNLKTTLFRLHQNETGSLNLATQVEGVNHFLHSKENPQEEARKWFNSLDLNNVEVLFVYGAGLGYFYDAAVEWLHQKSNHALVFIEDNLEVIRLLLETEQGTRLLHDQQVWLSYLSPDYNLLLSLTSNFVLKPYHFTALPHYAEHHQEAFSRLKSQYAFFLNLREGIAIEYSDHGRAFFSNFFRNMFELPEAYLGNKLFDKFKGIPAIICGAGPSLEKNLKVLEILGDRAIIFAGGTAMNALNATGFLPHLGVGIDPNPAQFTRLIMNQAYETPFLYRNRFLHDALDVIHGDHLYVTGTGGYDISRWIEEKLGIEGKTVAEGFNVVNFSMSIAHAMGCNPIIFVGLDLAYTDSKSYAPGIVHHPLHERREFYRTKSYEEDVISHNDIYGQPTLTLWKWVSESLWYTDFLINNEGIIAVNATEGGIGFKGVINKTLAEASDVLLNNQYDLDGLIWSEIQNSPLPPGAHREGVLKLMQELHESLKRCLEYCQIIRSDFENTEHQLKTEGKMPDNIISEKGIEALGKIDEEPAYNHLLKVFNDNFIDIYAGQFNRLSYDERLLSEQEINLKRVSLNSARYKFLRETSKIVLRILEQALKEEDDNQISKLLKAPKEPILPKKAKDKERYFYDDQSLNIYDPEMGLEVEEEFKPDEKITLNYPEGGLKKLQFKLGGKLHGPSYFYSKEGSVLSETWFHQGKRIGKAWTYYLEGPLHSIKRYVDGKREGKQEYYYPNGQLKTSLNYVDNLLDGEVKLYHSNGQLKRELTFSHGKRKGMERIWNVIGTLLIEAQFDEDKPVGTARKWYLNGNIEKEIVYDAASDAYTIREWDEMGQTVSREQRSTGDYFDQVAKQTEKLTEALNQVLNQVTSLSPAIEALSSEKKKAEKDDIPGELTKLRQGIEDLKGIYKKLAFETGIDSANKDEAIWKGPSSRKEVEKEISFMTKEMTNEMNTMQNALVTALGLLSKKITQMAKAKEEEKKAKEEETKKAKEEKPKESADEKQLPGKSPTV